MNSGLAILLALAPLAACSGSPRPDGGAVADAASDASSPDAGPPDAQEADACLAQASAPGLTTHSASVTYDKPMPSLTPPGLSPLVAIMGIYRDPSGIAVFRGYGFQRFDLAGDEIGSVLYPEGVSGKPILPVATEQGPLGYAILTNSDGLVGTQLCLVQPDGTVDLGQCSAHFPPSQGLPRLFWDGTRFVVLVATSTEMGAWFFDASGQSTGSRTLWAADDTSRNVIAASREDQRLVVFTEGRHAGTSCPTVWRHSLSLDLDPASRVSQDSMPQAAYLGATPPVVSSSGTSTSMVAAADCAVPSSVPCGAVPPDMELCAIWTADVATLMTTTCRLGAARSLWADGELLVLSTGPGPSDLRVVGFDAAGSQVLGADVVVSGTVAVLQGVVRVGPHDFMIVYLDPAGLTNRIARIQLAPF